MLRGEDYQVVDDDADDDEDSGVLMHCCELLKFTWDRQDWVQLQDLPFMKSCPEYRATIVINGSLYFVGGGGYLAGDTLGQTLAAVDRFDIKHETWTRLPDMPTARADCRLAVFEECLYALGGSDILEYDDLDLRDGGALEVFDLVAENWRTLEGVPTVRNSYAVVVHQGRIHTIGGYDWERGNACWSEKSYVIEMFDTQTLAWSRLADMPDQRFDCTAVAWNQYIFVIGGRAFGFRSNSVTRFDVPQGIWTELADSPVPVSLRPPVTHGCDAFSNGDCIYILGGDDSSNFAEGKCTLMKFCVQTYEWTVLPGAYHGSQGVLFMGLFCFPADHAQLNR